MKVLTLQITKENFQAILKGEQKVETRYVLPTTANKYIIQHEQENGDVDIEVIKYDALYLINGRKPNSPRLKVKVINAECVLGLDENGEYRTYLHKGESYIVSWMEYTLGEVFEKENC